MYKVKNAIILAAGRGSRLLDLTSNVPKPLLAPKNKSFIEGIIDNLQKKNINNIYVVTGYKHKKFSILKDKVKLIHNKNWAKGNNITSIIAAMDKIDNSLIINGDIIMEKNVFKSEYPYSLTYVEKNQNIDEWLVELDHNETVTNFYKKGLNKKGFYQKEIIFVTHELAKGIKKEAKTFDPHEYQEYLMINVAKKLNIKFGIHVIEKNIIFDLDTKQEYLKYANQK